MSRILERVAWMSLAAGLALFAGALGLKAWWPGEVGRVTLAAGESVEIGGDVLVLRAFRVPKYPSGKPRQFESEVHVVDPTALVSRRAIVSVNHPMIWKGQWIYQMSYDAETERATVLEVRRDPWLPLAAAAGVLLLLGALALVVGDRRASATARAGVGDRRASATARDGRGGACPVVSRSLWPRVVLAALVTLLPLFIVGRSVLRPEPVPALQSPLLAPHVAAYVASYLIMLFAAFGVGRRLMPLGFFFMTVGLVLGAVWGKICWGDFWQYDPKEMWSLATWLCFAAYFVFRRNARAEILLRVTGAVLVVLTLTWVNFSRLFSGLHTYASV